MSLREAGVTDEKIAIDFVASAHTSADIEVNLRGIAASHVRLSNLTARKRSD